MKFTMHVSLTAEVDAKDESDALKQLGAVTIGETTRLSTQIVPTPDHTH